MNEELLKYLNDELSPEKMGDLTPNELAQRLIELGLVENSADMNRMVIEQLQKIVRDGDEIPVHYYAPGEAMNEEHKDVKEECLTDDYIAANLNG